jgi:hypothetical protein
MTTTANDQRDRTVLPGRWRALTVSLVAVL